MALRTALIAACSLAVVAAGCGSSSTPTSAANATTTTAAAAAAGKPAAGKSATGTVHTASVSGVGKVLVDAAGRTVYLFEPDHQGRPTCTGSCAAAWPPVVATGSPVAGAGTRSSLLATVSGANGLQVTYGHWPLYTFSGDSEPGQANGEGVSAFGGYWYAVGAAGTAVKAGGSTSPAATSGSGAYGGY